MKKYAIILAAGKGTRMKTEMPKCAFPLLTKPMISYIVDSLEKCDIDEIVTIVGHKKEEIEKLLANRVNYAHQEEQLGTGHAVLCAKDYITDEGISIIIPGDTPLIDEDIINNLIRIHTSNNNDLTIGTIILDNPFGFGRIIRSNSNLITKIIEEKDANTKEKEIKEVNSGVYCISNKLLFSALKKVKPNAIKNEYYFTDIIEILSNEGYKIDSFTIKDVYKLNGINDLYTLSQIEKQLRNEINKKHMLNGVNIINPETVTISKDVIIEEGVTINQGCVINGNTIIKKGAYIGPNCEIVNSIIEEDTRILHSVIMDSRVMKNANVGPFAHLRMNSVVGENDRIGNFVEMKNSKLGEKTNVAHLTYIGDCECGDNVNWGCGTVTVNYDGKNKHKTNIGSNVFIGCNTNLIAPINVESNSYIAAGSTVTKDIKEGDFVIAREREVIKEGYASNYKKK